MFTWICPTCGRECPPSYTECPDCSAKPQTAPAATPAPGQPASSSPASPEQAPAPAAPRRPLAPPPVQAGGLPGWAVTLMVALVLIIVGGGAYHFISTRSPEPSVTAALQDSAAPAVASSHPYAKHFE